MRDASALAPIQAEQAGAIIAKFATAKGAALPMLHALQECFGYVPPEAEATMADTLNLSRADVRGIVSFYHEFRHAPPGRHVLKLCRAEACQAVGAVPLAASLLSRLNLQWGETTRDGSLTIEPAYCLGLCACGPAALMDGEPLAGLDAEQLNRLVAEARA